MYNRSKEKTIITKESAGKQGVEYMVLSDVYVFCNDNQRPHDQNYPAANYHDSFLTEKQIISATSDSPEIDIEAKQKLSSFAKRILIIDDDPDITLTFKKGLETQIDNDKKLYEVFSFNDPVEALSNFQANFYDLVLIDINMPKMNGFELSKQILKLDLDVKICFMSSGRINQEALREQYPTLSIGCFIGKPVTIEELVRKLKGKLD